MDLSRTLDTLNSMGQSLVQSLPLLVVALLVFTLFYAAGRILRFFILRFTRRRERLRNAGLVLARLAQGIIIFVGLLVALAVVIPTFSARDLIQLLGISSVAIGFAFRDVLQNFLAGILLLLTEPFRLGDQIVFEKFEGTVEDIQIRATTIRTYDGRRVVIPNADLFTRSVTVNTAFQNRRSEFDVAIGSSDDIHLAKRVILETVAGVDGVLADPVPQAYVVELADFSTKIRTLWWTAPPQRINILDVQDKVLTAIKQSLAQHGIDLPFPTQQILFHDQTEETDGDRHRQREGWPAGRDTPRQRWKTRQGGNDGKSREERNDEPVRRSARVQNRVDE
jgi:small conductance mechanosensitive channel